MKWNYRFEGLIMEEGLVSLFLPIFGLSNCFGEWSLSKTCENGVRSRSAFEKVSTSCLSIHRRIQIFCAFCKNYRNSQLSNDISGNYAVEGNPDFKVAIKNSARNKEGKKLPARQIIVTITMKMSWQKIEIKWRNLVTSTRGVEWMP